MRVRAIVLSLFAMAGIFSVVLVVASPPGPATDRNVASDAPPSLKTIPIRAMDRAHLSLKAPSSKAPVFSREDAERAALADWPGGSVREVVLAQLQDPPGHLARASGKNIWFISIWPSGGVFPRSIDSDLSAAYILHAYDAETGESFVRTYGSEA